MNNYDKIHDYKKGLLSEPDLADFERAMEEDKILRFAVNNYDAGMKLAGGMIEHEADEILKNIKKTNAQGSKIRHLKLFKRVSVAASIIILFGFVGYFTLFQNSITNYDQLVSLYFVQYGDIQRSSEVPDNILDQAKYYYNLNNFDKSTELFESINDDISLKYFAFISYQKENPEKAIEIIEDNNLEVEIELNYLKALSYLRVGRVEEGKQVLQEISETSQLPYSSNAAELLNKLE